MADEGATNAIDEAAAVNVAVVASAADVVNCDDNDVDLVVKFFAEVFSAVLGAVDVDNRADGNDDDVVDKDAADVADTVFTTAAGIDVFVRNGNVVAGKTSADVVGIIVDADVRVVINDDCDKFDDTRQPFK